MFASITRSLAIAGLSLALVLGQPANAQELEYKSSHVVANVLSDGSLERLSNQVSTNRFLRHGKESDTKIRRHGEATLSADELTRMLRSIGDSRQVQWSNKFRTTLLWGDTVPHTDKKVSGEEFDDEEEVMFVFLDNNEGAYFQIGEDKIPARKGAMVKFNGNKIVHNTVVPSGTEVRLLGPIDSRDLEDVGVECQFCCDLDEDCGPSQVCDAPQGCFCDEGCCAPNPTTTTTPPGKWGGLTSVIVHLIGFLLGRREDDLLDPAAQSEILAQLSTGPLADWVSPNDMEGIPTAVMSSIVGCGVDLEDLTSGGMPSEDALGCLRQAFGLPMTGEGLEGIEDIAGMSMSMP